jgi:hypothetical protein
MSSSFRAAAEAHQGPALHGEGQDEPTQEVAEAETLGELTRKQQPGIGGHGSSVGLDLKLGIE